MQFHDRCEGFAGRRDEPEPSPGASGTGVRIEAVAPYRGALRHLIKQLKFDGDSRLADPLGRLLLHGLEHHYDAARWDLMMANPTDVTRRVRHMELILGATARAARGTGWTIDDPACPSLVKAQPTPFSYGGSVNQRRAAAAALYDALAIPHREAVAGRRILPVDDVVTSGGQVEAISRKLMEGGAAAVAVLVLARAEGPPAPADASRRASAGAGSPPRYLDERVVHQHVGPFALRAEAPPASPQERFAARLDRLQRAPLLQPPGLAR